MGNERKFPLSSCSDIATKPSDRSHSCLEQFILKLEKHRPVGEALTDLNCTHGANTVLLPLKGASLAKQKTQHQVVSPLKVCPPHENVQWEQSQTDMSAQEFVTRQVVCAGPLRVQRISHAIQVIK